MSTNKHFRNDQNWTNAYAFHKKLIKNYMLYYRGKEPTNIPETYKTEKDIIRENHKFIRSNTDDTNSSWEQRVAKKYYDTLFKEYAICELKYYKEGKIALRWRTEKEVVAGKGQFMCGSTRCDASADLKSWEVNFGYVEDGEKKNELVKVRLCVACSDRLNYKTQRRQAKSKDKMKKAKKRSHSDDDDDDNDKGRRSKQSKRSHSVSSDDKHEQDDNKGSGSNSIWSKPLEAKEERTKEEEYEDYFADLLQ
ncbi:hypothetical protein K501DRAFT_327226 [Backusella circina FSU 941]|nr:hypothetical protein K501DRAFT_327226 [Backusella circina FSU 941]